MIQQPRNGQQCCAERLGSQDGYRRKRKEICAGIPRDGDRTRRGPRHRCSNGIGLGQILQAWIPEALARIGWATPDAYFAAKVSQIRGHTTGRVDGCDADPLARSYVPCGVWPVPAATPEA